MFKHKESYFYLILGIILLILTFQNLDFLDRPIGSDGYLFNIRFFIFIFGIFFLIFPPSESIRIVSLGSWIINLVKSIRGSDSQNEYPHRYKKGSKNIEDSDEYLDQPSFRE
jgi:hypothetical protein